MSENYSTPQNNEIGRKTFFWYRVYCGVLVGFYLFVMIYAISQVISPPILRELSPREKIDNILFIVLGAGFSLIFAVALFLPPKPYNWIVGIILIGIGMTLCCFIPACVPLLIFWMKPETKAFFGRNS